MYKLNGELKDLSTFKKLTNLLQQNLSLS